MGVSEVPVKTKIKKAELGPYYTNTTQACQV